MAADAALALYARAPRAGAVKTRLVPWLDAAEALRLHLALLEDSLRLLKDAAGAAAAAPFLCLSQPGTPGDIGTERALSEASLGIERLPQRGADLGDRLLDTFRTLFARGHPLVVVIGSDSPTLPVAIVARACEALRQGADAVLAPAEDGGYCLAGATRPIPEMFAGIPWGTASVFEATAAALDRAGARRVVLPGWYDVDRPEDLDRLGRELAERDPAGGGARTRAFVDGLLRDGRLPLRRPDPGRSRTRNRS